MNSARIHARPKLAESPASSGLHRLPGRALLYVPESGGNGRLAISLHGAGGSAEHGISMLREESDRHGFALLAPSSKESSWDVIAGGYGPDVRALDAVLSAAFKMYSVQGSAIAISGFSDGASYALCLGVANGDLFPHIIAFSPGFASSPAGEGSPEVFVSHGTRDEVLPIDSCSRRLVPRLRRAGYTVDYREFVGGHTVPSEMKTAAIDWWLR